MSADMTLFLVSLLSVDLEPRVAASLRFLIKQEFRS